MDLVNRSELLERGFELAYFIAQDRISAIEIVTRALDKLSMQCRREKRRFYWRYNRACHPIRRITHQELDVFQWLIMSESETWERAQEMAGKYSLRDMLVRYIKYLIQITTPMSSFYVCIGLNRLLYSYSASETQTAFEMVTQRFPGADQYRRAKKTLTSQLRERFGALVEPVRTRHGEIRFKTLEDQDCWQDLVHECLSMFSPWSTVGWCKYFRPRVDDILRCCLSEIERPALGPDAQETIYSHMFIEPMCRGTLSEVLSLSSPEVRLALPRFAVKQEARNENGAEKTRVTKLSDEEMALIAARLNVSKASGQRIRPSSISELERSHHVFQDPNALQVELAEGA